MNNKTQNLNRGMFSRSFIAGLDGDARVQLADKYLTKEIMAVLKDTELKNSIDAFFENDLNISETSRNSYMHRNTLLYRIDKIHKMTGLDIRKFDDAVALLIFETLYESTKNLR